jgi:hypothetical protein
VGAPVKPHKLGAELVTYRVLEDPASLAPARGGTSWRARHSTSEDSVCHITLISLLPTVVLQLAAASLDSFGDPAYDDLRDPV